MLFIHHERVDVDTCLCGFLQETNKDLHLPLVSLILVKYASRM